MGEGRSCALQGGGWGGQGGQATPSWGSWDDNRSPRGTYCPLVAAGATFVVGGCLLRGAACITGLWL